MLFAIPDASGMPCHADLITCVCLGSTLHAGGATSVCVSEVVDIEENIWAPRFGLKGQIDATLRVTLRSK